jgi:hypothetical protein
MYELKVGYVVKMLYQEAFYEIIEIIPISNEEHNRYKLKSLKDGHIMECVDLYNGSWVISQEFIVKYNRNKKLKELGI